MSTKGGRRGNKEGSIRKRAEGRWEARIMLSSGARRSVYGKTRLEVVRLLEKIRREDEIGLSLFSDRQSVAQYLASWLEATAHTVKPRTHRRTSEYVRLHITPMLGKAPLAKLTAQRLQALYAERLSAGLSPTTVRHLHAVIHASLEAALRLDLVPRNVADLVDPPRAKRHEMTTLSEEEAQAFLGAARGERLEALYVLAVTTGMRQGELLALKWRDVDLAGRSLQVRATLQNNAGHFFFTEPKTARSRRRIALPQVAVEALREHKIRQAQERLKVGSAWEDLDLVFPNKVGRPLDGMNLLRYFFRPLLARAGLPPMRFHDLRHTAATLLLSRSINPKIVSEMLGHASVAITLDIYSHVTPHMQQQAADAMDAAFNVRG